MRANRFSTGLFPALLLGASLFAMPVIAVDHVDGEGMAYTEAAACDLARSSVRYKARCLPGSQVSHRTESECSCQVRKEQEGDHRDFFYCMARVSWECAPAAAATTTPSGDCIDVADPQQRLECFEEKSLGGGRGGAPKPGVWSNDLD